MLSTILVASDLYYNYLTHAFVEPLNSVFGRGAVYGSSPVPVNEPSRRSPRRLGAGLDDIDRAIIRELQQDGRRTYGRIAEAVGLSEAATRQRVGRLVKEEAIQIVAIVNSQVLGYRFRASIGMRVEGPLEEVVAALAEIEELVWLVGTAGSFDLLADFSCRNDRHFYEVISELRRAVPGVRRAETFIHFDILKEQHPWPPGSGRRSPPAAAPGHASAATGRDAPQVVKLDELDRGIIRQLQDDGRRTYGRIAEAIGLSEPSTRQRVGHLIGQDVIQIVAIINPEIAEHRLMATIGIVCAGDPRAAAAELAAIDDVEDLFATTGRFDFLAEVRCDDEQHLYRLLAYDIRNSSGVRAAEALVHLNIAKVRYTWPPGFAVGGSKAPA